MREKPSPRLPSRIEVIVTVAMRPQSTRYAREPDARSNIGSALSGLLHRKRRIDQSDVGKSLREIPQGAPVFRIELFREQADFIRKGERVLEELLRLIEIAPAREMVNSPEGAYPERALFAGEVVVPALIAVEEAVAPQPLPNAVVGAPDAWVTRVLESETGHQQQARIHGLAIEFEGVAGDGVAVPALLDGLGNLAPFLLELAPQLAQPHRSLFVELEQPVERDPAHQLGEGVMPGLAADLPDSVVRFAPLSADHRSEERRVGKECRARGSRYDGIIIE